MRSTRLRINASTSPFSVVQGAKGLTTKSTNSATMESPIRPKTSVNPLSTFRSTKFHRPIHTSDRAELILAVVILIRLVRFLR